MDSLPVTSHQNTKFPIGIQLFLLIDFKGTFPYEMANDGPDTMPPLL